MEEFQFAIMELQYHSNGLVSQVEVIYEILVEQRQSMGRLLNEVSALWSHLVDLQFQRMEAHPPPSPNVSEATSSPLVTNNPPN
jgi:hypothetical protein